MRRSVYFFFLSFIVFIFLRPFAQALDGDAIVVKIYIQSYWSAHDYRLFDSAGNRITPIKIEDTGEYNEAFALYTFALEEGEIYSFMYTKTTSGVAHDTLLKFQPGALECNYTVNAFVDTLKPSPTPSPSPSPAPAENSDKLTVIPSNANALILSDSGALSPSGNPGEYVRLTLSLRVNREYLPSEQYALRNITIEPDIPTKRRGDINISDWPFDIEKASYIRHLSDMSYDSSTDVAFEFRILENAEAGIYPVVFKLNATVWRYDGVNGTHITEDVAFTLSQYVKVLGDGSSLSAGESIVELSAEWDGEELSAPSGKAGERVTVLLPVTSHGDLSDVSIEPIFSSNVSECPIVYEAVNYTKRLPDIAKGEHTLAEFDLRLLPSAKSGNSPLSFRLRYVEGGVKGEHVITTFVYIEPETDASGEDETKPSPAAAPVLTVESYRLESGGSEVKRLMAGESARLTLKVRNHAASETAHRLRVTLTPDASVALDSGESGTSYTGSLGSGESASVSFGLAVPGDAQEGISNIAVDLIFESASGEVVKHSQQIGVAVKQKSRAALNPPMVNNGEPAAAGEPIPIKSTLLNLGRSRLMNVRAHVEGEGFSTFESFYGQDVPPSGSISVRLQILSEPGNRKGHLMLTYEDSDGEEHELYEPLSFVVSDAPEAAPSPSPAPVAVISSPAAENGVLKDALIAGASALAVTLAAIAAYMIKRRRKR